MTLNTALKAVVVAGLASLAVAKAVEWKRASSPIALEPAAEMRDALAPLPPPTLAIHGAGFLARPRPILHETARSSAKRLPGFRVGPVGTREEAAYFVSEAALSPLYAVMPGSRLRITAEAEGGPVMALIAPELSYAGLLRRSADGRTLEATYDEVPKQPISIYVLTSSRPTKLAVRTEILSLTEKP